MVTYNSRISIINSHLYFNHFTSEWNKKPLLLTNHTWRSRHQATYGPFKYYVCTYSWKIITPDTYIVKTFLRSKHPYSGLTILVTPLPTVYAEMVKAKEESRSYCEVHDCLCNLQPQISTTASSIITIVEFDVTQIINPVDWLPI